MSSRSAPNLRIISRSDKPFSDRAEAGRLLAEELHDIRGQHAVILGIPRGGVVLAAELADKLDAELDVVLSRKLGTPGQPELAMGSLAEDGTVFLNDYVVHSTGVSKQAIEREKTHQQAEIERRSTMIRAVRPKVALRDRVVVVCDDGVATGATMQAALWATRHEEPRSLVAAVPVASEEALRRLAEAADEVVCLRLPQMFYAVGQAYYEFSQVEDEDGLRILKNAVQAQSQP